MSFTAIIAADNSSFERAVRQSQKSAEELATTTSQKMKEIGESFSNVGRRLSVFSAAFVAAGGASFKMAADFEDALGATDQVFKASAESVKDWANSLSPSYGIAKKEALEYANVMGSMLVNIGQLSQEQAAVQAQSLIKLAGDLTAMFGGSTQDAVRALTGSLKGNNTMLDNYGMAVNDALVKTKALEMGLISQGEEMSLSAKQAATLALIYEQSGAAQGQAAREAEGASGSMRALAVEAQNLATSFGEALLPVITPLITRLGDMVEWLNGLSPAAKNTVLLVGGIVAAIGPFLLVLGKLIAIAPLVGTAFTTMTGPIGIAIALIAGAALLIIKNWDAIKEYFSGGEGGGMFDTVKEAALSLWESIKTIFNTIKDFAIQVWAVIGDRVTALWKLAVDNLMAVFKLLVDNFKAVADFWAAIVDGDMQGALDALGDMFMNIFNFLGRIVTNFVSGAARAIAGFLEAIGLEKWSAAVDRFADNMAAAFQPPKKEIIETKKAVEESTSAVSSLNEAVITTANGFGALRAKGGEATKAIIDGAKFGIIYMTELQKQVLAVEEGVKRVARNKDFMSAEQIVLPDLTPRLNDALLKADMQRMSDSMQGQVLDMSDAITNTIGNFAAGIGEAMGAGNFEGLGASLLKALGSLAQQMGVMLLGMGKAAVALKAMIANPIAAVAAGIALIALGAAATAAAGSMVSGATGGGGGYSGGASSSYQAATPGASDMRGAFMDDFSGKVRFEIGNDKLEGVLEQRDARRNRLG
jgi:hypothetical protein